jgi:KEOPS complex subunit Cgi121
MPRAQPLITYPEVPHAYFFGAGGDPPPVETALDRVASVERRHSVRVHFVDAKVVCGPAHLASALLHARRSHERGRPRARDPKVELMLYLTGRRQITRALEAAGISKATHHVGFALEGEAQAAEEATVNLLHELDLSRSDEALTASEAKARALGVRGDAEHEQGWEALALEVVALLDLA